jgi:spoIIIJ-associated protein
MNEVEISAKTVEEATKLALEELGTSRGEVEVDVLSEGSHGVLGIGAEEARVRVRLLKPTPSEVGPEPTSPEPAQGDDVVSFTRSVLETILAKMGVTASVVSKTEAIIQEVEKTPAPVAFDIEGEGLGILIGRRGQTLACLQYITRLIVAQEMKAPTPTIVIDVAGYKQRRYQALQALAWRLAKQVATSGNQFALEPMPAYERRIVHLTLGDHSDVATESIGVGEARKVVILPKGQSISAIS